MQNHTNPGGYNLIVAAMSTPEVPCPLPFSFTFSEGELKEYYKGLGILRIQRKIWASYTKPMKTAIALN